MHFVRRHAIGTLDVYLFIIYILLDQSNRYGSAESVAATKKPYESAKTDAPKGGRVKCAKSNTLRQVLEKIAWGILIRGNIALFARQVRNQILL